MKRRKPLTNIAASVRQRLYNLAHELGEDFNLILSRYAIERLLYRLSQSPYANEFVLKGAQLFYVWTDSPHRTTRDLDLLRRGSITIPELEVTFRTICKQSAEEPDGMAFVPETVHGEEIREQAEYRGVRIRFMYQLGEARGTLQVDVGFGDVLTPPPKIVEFPSLLEFPAPRIKAYQREAVVAEKFQAVVTLGIGNSRMKDFYDLSMFAGAFHFDGETLGRAIDATFRRRKTVLPSETPLALSPDFAEDQIKQKQWQAFLNKNRLQPTKASLKLIIKMIREFVMPLTLTISKKQRFEKIWPPGGPWQDKRRSK